MLRPATVALALSSTLAPATLGSQAVDTARVRAAFAAVFGGASKGGFVAAAVYDHYPNRVLGLLMADGGTWSNQWVFDRQSPDQTRRQMADPLPRITGASEFDHISTVVSARLLT